MKSGLCQWQIFARSGLPNLVQCRAGYYLTRASQIYSQLEDWRQAAKCCQFLAIAYNGTGHKCDRDRAAEAWLHYSSKDVERL